MSADPEQIILVQGDYDDLASVSVHTHDEGYTEEHGTEYIRADLVRQQETTIARLTAENEAQRAVVAEAREAMSRIANHSERHDDRKWSHGFGWAFWNVQNIARAAIARLDALADDAALKRGDRLYPDGGVIMDGHRAAEGGRDEQ
jgi:hypothetical protein